MFMSLKHCLQLKMRSDHNYDLLIQQVLCFLFVFFLFKVWDAIRPRALGKKKIWIRFSLMRI